MGTGKDRKSNMNYNEHTGKSKGFRALTRLSHEQFCALLPYFKTAHEDYLFDL